MHEEIPATQAEAVVEAHALCGEGPVWDHRANLLRWVDLWGKVLHAYDPATGENRSIGVHEPLAAVAPRLSGGLILALRDGFWTMDETTRSIAKFADVCSADTRIGLNDGRCDSAGRFWAGTAALDERTGTGALQRLDRDRSVVEIVGGVTISNGLDWSPDDRMMYYADTPLRRVDVFDYERVAGTVVNRRPFVSFSDGLPDGLTVDAEGFVWIALLGAGCVHRYSPAGQLDKVIHLPISFVTSCAFGGPQLSDLYITSASHWLSPAERMEQPLAGALFRVRNCGVGRPAHFYAG